MTDFALGAYCALTILWLAVFAVIFANEGRRIGNLEWTLSLLAILCWPILALAVALATAIKKTGRTK